jgi:hypothetical protein
MTFCNERLVYKMRQGCLVEDGQHITRHGGGLLLSGDLEVYFNGLSRCMDGIGWSVPSRNQKADSLVEMRQYNDDLT